MEKSTQIFTMIKYQKKTLNVLSISIGSIYKKDKNYYPQVFLEEFKYVVTVKKTSKFITDNL